MTALPLSPMRSESSSLSLFAFLYTLSSFLSVSLPATPSAVRFYFFWNARTAAYVPEPNVLSTVPS